jgi:hypothetical protein
MCKSYKKFNILSPENSGLVGSLGAVHATNSPKSATTSTLCFILGKFTFKDKQQGYTYADGRIG